MSALVIIIEAIIIISIDQKKNNTNFSPSPNLENIRNELK